MKPNNIIPTILMAAMLAGCGKKDDAPSKAPPPAASAPTPSAPAAAPNPEFRKLQGKWRRPDGGYVIDIRSVDETSGKLEAGYFNPQPITVSKAKASREGAITQVFIELQGANYTGSTYSLAYDPATDRLHGIYFQAVMRQQFEVFFERLK